MLKIIQTWFKITINCYTLSFIDDTKIYPRCYPPTHATHATHATHQLTLHTSGIEHLEMARTNFRTAGTNNFVPLMRLPSFRGPRTFLSSNEAAYKLKKKRFVA